MPYIIDNVFKGNNYITIYIMEDTTTHATKMQKYYRSLDDDKKQEYKKKLVEYQKNRYNNDEDYKKKICEAKKAKYDTLLKNDPKEMERRRIYAYVYGLNVRAWAGKEVKKTKKFDEYEIYYNEFDGCYVSKKLNK